MVSVTNQPAPQSPGGANRPVPYDPTAPAYTPGNPGANITVGTPSPGPGQPGYYPAVGTSTYDVYRIHELMVDAGYGNGDWEMVGQPVQVIGEKANPLYDPANPDPSVLPTIQTASNDWIVNIRNAKTNEIKQIKMSKQWPTASGGVTQADPGDNSQYRYSPTTISDLQKQDPNKVGHSNLMTIGSTIYGTNNATGAFEAVPGAPTVPKGWTEIKQITDKNGDLVWYGNDPADQQYKQMPGMPTIPAAAQGWGDPRQIDNGQGQMVWYGIDPVDKQLKPMPNMPTVAKQTGPGSITQAGTVYVLKPDGTYGPAPGVPDPNPPVGTTRNTLDNNGYIVQEVYRGGGQWQFDPTFKTVPYTDAAKAAAAKLAGTTTHQAGETGDKLLSDGKVYRVTYKGGGDDNYEVDTSVPARPMAGTVTPSTIATSTDQPNIVQRMPDGTVQTVPNPNYQPTDPAQRVQQLSSQATAKLQELQAKISQTYTPEQAQSDFDQWWSSNIDPAKQQLAQDQQQKQLDYQLKVAAEQRAGAQTQGTNYSTALQAGRDAVDAAKAATANMVGPNFGNLVGQMVQGWQHPGGPGPSSADIASAVTYQTPNYQQISQNAVAQALAHISPTAAAIAGGPGSTPQFAQYSGLDYNQLLNRNAPQYQFHANPIAVNTGAAVAAGGGQTLPAAPYTQPGTPPWLGNVNYGAVGFPAPYVAAPYQPGY